MPEEEKLPRARRVVPSASELNSPSLDADLTPTRPHHDDEPRHERPRPRRRRPEPTGPEPFATSGMIFGILAIAIGCCWPVSGPAALAAIVCGGFGLSGRARPQAIVALALGTVTLAASLGVMVTSVLMLVQENQPSPVIAPPAPLPAPIPWQPTPFLPD